MLSCVIVLFLLTQETETALLRIDPSSKEVAYNPTFDQLFAPEVQLLQGLTVDKCSVDMARFKMNTCFLF